MRRTTSFFAATLVLVGCASAPEKAIVNGTASALGGADKVDLNPLAALKS